MVVVVVVVVVAVAAAAAAAVVVASSGNSSRSSRYSSRSSCSSRAVAAAAVVEEEEEERGAGMVSARCFGFYGVWLLSFDMLSGILISGFASAGFWLDACSALLWFLLVGSPTAKSS